MKAASQSDLYRKLPAIDDLLRTGGCVPLIAREGQAAVTDAARAVLASLREEIAAGRLVAVAVDQALSGLTDAVDRELRRAASYSLRSVINATGVILHTNLGRAPLLTAAADHIRDTALGYSNLEFETSTGERGRRDVHVDRLFRKLLADDARVGAALRPSPSENGSDSVATIVVNNNAAAVLLALNTLAENGEVIVSRGELVEIGGSFRIPDVMSKSHATLHEVGTTNRTRVEDYERAITDKTKLLLRVHRSNFEISGFTEQPRIEELVALSRARSIPLVEDLGSGALFDLRSIGVSGEPDVLGSLRAGVDVVTYSGDKLLGGPQAGLLSGRPDLISRMRANSLFRALRVDKLTYAALEATLLAYVKHDHDAIPALRMMRMPKAEITARAKAIVSKGQSPDLEIELIDGESVIGGGAAPSATLPTTLLAVASKSLSAGECSVRLRASDPPIVARIEDGRLLIDLRTVFPAQDPQIVAALKNLWNTSQTSVLT